MQIDIIKHPKEVDGKSTSAHAAVLAPDDVKIYIYPDFPSYENENVSNFFYVILQVAFFSHLYICNKIFATNITPITVKLIYCKL